MPSWLHWILAITICSSGGLAQNSISRDVLCQEKEAANTTRACKESGRRKLRALKGPQKEIIDVGVDESLHSPWDQRLALYFSNPRAVSLLVTPRASKYGSRRLVYEPRTDSKGPGIPTFLPSARWMAALFPKALYLSPRNQAMNRFVAFLMPPSLVMRKFDDYPQLWHATHDRRTLAVVVGDELCEQHFAGELQQGRHSKGWHGPTVRNYWDDASMFSSSQGGAQYLPLGPRFEFPMVQDADAHKHPTKRRYLFNMMASLDTHPDRKALHDRLTAAVAEANQRREGGGDGGATKSSASGAVEDTGSLPLLSSGYLHNAVNWANLVPTALTEGAAVPTEAYRDVLLSSVFTLCPTGHSPETFRLFEAAEAGSIPIVHYAMPSPSSSSSSSSSSIGGSGSSSRGTASTSSSDLLKTTKSSSSKKKSASAQVAQVAASSKCQDPWRPFIESGAPFVWVEDWDDIVTILAVLRRDPVRVANMQNDVIEWYHRFMATSMDHFEASARTHLASWLVHRQAVSLHGGGARDGTGGTSGSVNAEATAGMLPPLVDLLKHNRQVERSRSAPPDEAAVSTMASHAAQQERAHLMNQQGTSPLIHEVEKPTAQAMSDFDLGISLKS